MDNLKLFSNLQTIAASIELDSILVLRIENREYKNTFSPQLIEDLDVCLRLVNESSWINVVVLTGFDSYFLSGGSKEELIQLHQGEMQFTDINTYRFGIDVDVPVIAAMQGHAIGGGLVLGLFCDQAVLSKESIYTFNFMKYGFTPGMGATLIAPLKLGSALASEMLMTAHRYRGAALQARGVPMEVLQRSEVLPFALRLAADMANMPRNALVELKRHLNKDLNARLHERISQELVMHEQTIHHPDVLARIGNLF